MFTGIVEEVGTVLSATEVGQVLKLRLGCRGVLVGLNIGDSVAINGCCLTVVELDDQGFEVDAVAETVSRANIGALAVGDSVNLERALAADGRFGGHIVQGHVDGPAVLAEIRGEPGGTIHRYEIGGTHARYVVEKGSVTIDGVSLTVSAVGGPWIEVALVPHTLESTTFGAAAVGHVANLEVDLVAKYIERLLANGRAGSRSGGDL